MTTAFVLSGGASLAAVQVGMLQALTEAGVRPDFLVGTSAGAFNAAWVAGHPAPEELAGLEEVWRGMRRQDVFPSTPALVMAGIVGRTDHLFSTRGLDKVIRKHIRFDRLENAAVPVHMVGTEVLTGREFLISSGDTVAALMATSAIPGVFPPVTIQGRALIDGGVADNTPIRHAIDLGADRIFVLPGGYACALPRPPGSALGMALHALTLMFHQRLAADVERYERYVELVVLPPPCPLSVAPTDFAHSTELIRRSRTLARRWLTRSRPRTGQADVLAFHGPHAGAAPRSAAVGRAGPTAPRAPSGAAP